MAEIAKAKPGRIQEPVTPSSPLHQGPKYSDYLLMPPKLTSRKLGQKHRLAGIKPSTPSKWDVGIPNGS